MQSTPGFLHTRWLAHISPSMATKEHREHKGSDQEPFVYPMLRPPM